MGTVTFNTNVEKTVDIDKFVTLDVDKDVVSFVNLTGNLATAEASADATGTFAGPVEEGFELVDSVGDLTREEIHVEWWDRAANFPFPGDVLPFNEPTGALQGLGQDVPGVFLIDGTGADLGAVTRNFVVPFGDTLAIPLVNVFTLAFPGEDPPVEQVAPLFESIIEESLFLVVDGENVPLDTLLETRAATGEFDLTVELGGFLDDVNLMPGETFPAAADGYLVLLEGLDPGPHTITFGGVAELPEPIDVMVTINILVRQAQGALAETDTFAQVTDTGAFAFSESLAALGFTETDAFIM